MWYTMYDIINFLPWPYQMLKTWNFVLLWLSLFFFHTSNRITFYAGFNYWSDCWRELENHFLYLVVCRIYGRKSGMDLKTNDLVAWNGKMSTKNNSKRWLIQISNLALLRDWKIVFGHYSVIYESFDYVSMVGTGHDRHVTFLCGRGGVYALGAVVANIRGDHHKRDLFLDLFNEVH